MTPPPPNPHPLPLNLPYSFSSQIITMSGKKYLTKKKLWKFYKVRLSCQNKPARLSSCSQDTGSMPILGVNDHSSQRTSFHNLVSGRMYAAPKPSHAYPYHMWQRSFTYGSEVLQCSNHLVPIRKWHCTSFHNMTGPLWY